jgi:hypothetical protein
VNEPVRAKKLTELLAMTEEDLNVYLAEVAMAFGDASTQWEYLQENADRWQEEDGHRPDPRESRIQQTNHANLNLQHARRTLLDALTLLDPRCWTSARVGQRVHWTNLVTGEKFSLAWKKVGKIVTATLWYEIQRRREEQERFTLAEQAEDHREQ